jgi:uncharacterized protein (UPF0548 family)
VLSLSKPSREALDAFISRQGDEQFSYSEVGCSRTGAPSRYNLDHNRILLGQGVHAFDRAKNAIRQWKMFDMPWVQLCWPDAPTEAGQNVAVLVSHRGLWSLNACRIVYILEEHTAIEKYGFAYGTLREHQEIGEERFTVEFHLDDGTVWYDLYAFSRPHFAARLVYPYSRSQQKRFAKDSLESMRRFVVG